MKSWHALHVLTGAELDVLTAVRGLGITAIVPMEMRLERRGGRLKERLHIYVPGYVLVNLELTPGAYYAVKATPGVIRWLGGGHPDTIPDEQMRIMLALSAHGETMKPAKAARCGGRSEITSGPLRTLSPKIVSVDARNGRATIAVSMLDHQYHATVSIQIQP
jgi:transcriptional antiterminator NusG